MTTKSIPATLAKLGGTGFALALLIGSQAPAAALTAKECSDKYNAAKAAGTLGGKSWNQFRKTECAAAATGTPAAAPATDAKKDAPKVTVPAKPAQPAPAAQAKPSAQAPTPAPAPAAAAAPAAAPSKTAAPAASGSGPSYPSAIAPAYAKEKPSKARMHTCLDQYKANKAAGTLGGMRWIQKAGGYYSECNKRLKTGN